MINLNGKLIDYNQNFTLILSSRNEHFQIGSELKSLVSIMNFTVTHSGLTGKDSVQDEEPVNTFRMTVLLINHFFLRTTPQLCNKTRKSPIGTKAQAII